MDNSQESKRHDSEGQNSLSFHLNFLHPGHSVFSGFWFILERKNTYMVLFSVVSAYTSLLIILLSHESCSSKLSLIEHVNWHEAMLCSSVSITEELSDNMKKFKSNGKSWAETKALPDYTQYPFPQPLHTTQQLSPQLPVKQVAFTVNSIKLGYVALPGKKVT